MAQILVKITNITIIEGHIHIGLYDDPEVYLLEGKELLITKSLVTNNEMIIPIHSLAAGDYAISLFHDINSNGEIEKNVFGIPKEPYGFSLNYRPLFRAPKYSECSFNYDGKRIEIDIILLD